MPQPTAIQLTGKTVDVIISTLGIPENEVYNELSDSIQHKETIYYVANVLYGSNRLPYLIYSERCFLEDFARIPRGIQLRFVPVVQVKKESP